MAFGIRLLKSDFEYMASQMTRPELDAIDVLNSQKIWDGGLRFYEQAPHPTYELTLDDPGVLILSFNTTNMSSTELVAAMRRMSLVNNAAKYPATATHQDSVYLDALADHINNTKIEPYNE